MASGNNVGEEIVVNKNIPMEDKPDSGARSEQRIGIDSSGRTVAEDDRRGYKSELSQMLMRMKDGGSRAQRLKNIGNLRKIVGKNSSLLKRQETHNGETALHIAAEFGILDGAEELIKLGAKIEATDRDGRQPLHIACLNGQEQLVALLLKKGADTEAPQYQGATPLDDAVQHIAAVKVLLEYGAKTQVKNKDGWTPLHTAVVEGTTDVLKFLLTQDKSNIDDTEENENWTALNLAVYLERREFIPILLAFGARLDIPDKDGWLPWTTALQGHTDIIDLLKTHLEDRDARDDTPLLAATRDGLWESAATLIEIGANCTAQGFNGRTPLHWACINGHETTVRGPHEADESREESQPDRYGAIIKFLLEKGADIKAQSNRQETALHFAASKGSLERLAPILKNADAADVSAQTKDGWTALRCAYEGEQCAVALPELIRSGKAEKADFGSGTADGRIWNDAVEHFVNNYNTHDVVDWLLKNKIRTVTVPISSEQWSSIEWAAYEQNPKVLSFLIRNSDSDSTGKQVEKALKHALEVSKASLEVLFDTGFIKVLYILINSSARNDDNITEVKEALETVRRRRLKLESQPRGQATLYTPKAIPNAPGQHDRRKRGREADRTKQTSRPSAKNEDDSKNNRQKKLQQLKNLEDILRHPPFTHVHRYIRSFPLVEPKPDSKGILDNVEASVTQFFQSREESGTILRYRSIKDVIFSPGPKEIMQNAAKALKNITEEESGSPGYSFGVDTKPEFTWVHLPSTNIDWMKNLLRTIMENDNCGPRQYYEVNSFLSESLAQIPDEDLPSRYMRPRTTTRSYTHTDKKDEGEKRDRTTTNEGVAEQGSHESESDKGDPEKDDDLESKSKEGPEAVKPPHVHVPSSTAIYMPFLCFSTRTGQKDQSSELRNSTKKNERKVVIDADTHGSPTLDEWYYHFRDDPKSIADKYQRNQNQVVTKYLRAIQEAAKLDGGNQESVLRPDDCTLLHVNQLWVWTIADKWLITATSCGSDDSHKKLEEVILDLLHKQADSRGSSSQPKSAEEMSKLIVKYVIGSYERNPKLKGLMSIGQIFSQYLNQIGRDESLMFDEFRIRTQSWQIPGARNSQNRMRQSSGSVDVGLVATQSQSSRTPPTASTDEEIRNAIRKTENLFTDIKDVRDELNILKAIVQYQKIVERGLVGENVKDTDLLAENILGDIKEMEVVAERIQLAVNTTLSLQQSEIANFQATLATTQGKTIMAFTFATVLFLPLSFLSSLFALDVASFQEAPAWAFYVIFLVSAAISLFLAYMAYHWERLNVRIRNAYMSFKVFAASKNDGIGMTTNDAEGVTADSSISHPVSTGGLFHHPRSSQGRGESYV
ncbi:1-alkyl-2-acetylglycerophosphocholine esterase [Fusarium sp. NRRL 25303]|nr:1-alkyl-2-acetylglycerophosphocholine esterase [Fusarium sp. NRRL 25303]